MRTVRRCSKKRSTELGYENAIEADANLQLMRKVVYTFHARVATQWQKGRASWLAMQRI
jgi:hypothetical protein